MTERSDKENWAKPVDELQVPGGVVSQYPAPPRLGNSGVGSRAYLPGTSRLRAAYGVPAFG